MAQILTYFRIRNTFSVLRKKWLLTIHLYREVAPVVGAFVGESGWLVGESSIVLHRLMHLLPPPLMLPLVRGLPVSLIVPVAQIDLTLHNRVLYLLRDLRNLGFHLFIQVLCINKSYQICSPNKYILYTTHHQRSLIKKCEIPDIH